MSPSLTNVSHSRLSSSIFWHFLYTPILHKTTYFWPMAILRKWKNTSRVSGSWSVTTSHNSSHFIAKLPKWKVVCNLYTDHEPLALDVFFHFREKAIFGRKLAEWLFETFYLIYYLWWAHRKTSKSRLILQKWVLRLAYTVEKLLVLNSFWSTTLPFERISCFMK